MAFSNGFEEDDHPQPLLPHKRPLSPATESADRISDVVDLTASPPPPAQTNDTVQQPSPKRSRHSEPTVSPSLASNLVAQSPAQASAKKPTPLQLDKLPPVNKRVVNHVQQQVESPISYSAQSPTAHAGATPAPALAASNNAAVGFAKYAHQQQLPANSATSFAGASTSQFQPPRSTAAVSSSPSSFSPIGGQPLHGRPAGQSKYPHHPTQASSRSVPVINGASAARVPSASLQGPPTSSSSLPATSSHPHKAVAPHQTGPKNYYAMQSATVRKASQDALMAGSHRSRTMSGSTLSSNATGGHADSKGKQKAATADTIDLTSDVTPVVDLSRSRSSSSAESVIVDDHPICIGQLTSLALILYHVPEILPPTVRDEHGEPVPIDYAKAQSIYIPPLPVHILRSTPQANNETLKLVTPHRRETFGVMEHRVANLIAPLLGDGWSGTGINVPTTGKIWCEASVVRRAEKTPMMLPLQLLLFAKPGDVPYISDLLSSRNVYLEHPRSYQPIHHFGARYMNPHNPAAGVGAQAEQRRQRLQNGLAGIGAGVDGMTRAPQTTQAVDAIRRIMQEMPSGPDLDEVEPPPIVSTKLYTHQKQALAFLLDRERIVEIPPPKRTAPKVPPKVKRARERGKCSRDDKGALVLSSGDEDDTAEEPPKSVGEPIVSLWQRVVTPYGTVTGWDHLASDLRITGERGPPQTRGAILADDMGLGKTIVVISLVASTLEDAKAYAAKPPTRDSFDERFDALAGKSKVAASNANLSEFGSNLYGLAPDVPPPPSDPQASGSGTGGNSKKKQQARLKREKKREDAIQSRFERIVCRSRATLIVCPLSTVQNWESQFEEHTAPAPAGGEVTAHATSSRTRGRSYRVAKDKLPQSIIVELEDGQDSVDAAVVKAEPPQHPKQSDGDDDSQFSAYEDDSAAAQDDQDDAVEAGTSASIDDEHDEIDSEDEYSDDDGEKSGPSKGKGKAKAGTKRKGGKSAASTAAGKKKTGQSRALSIYVYHGTARTADARVLADHDVVITTYSTLGTEYSKQCRAEDEREVEELRRTQEEQEGGKDEVVEVFGYGKDGEIIETKPWDEVVQPGKKLKRRKQFKRKVEGSGVSPLQQIQWFRIVLDEAHIIKEHTTIQARAACDLSAERRVALSGTPLQNSLNDLFSLVRFLRLEPLTERSTWTQHIGALVKAGLDTGIERLRLIMRHLTLRRTKDSKDKDGKPILSLPPVVHSTVKLRFTPAEHAYYTHYHQRYKHDFEKLERTDSVMKNICSILQELLRLRQICVHPALLQDSEDLANGGGGDAASNIEQHGISKSRAIQLLAPMKDIGGAQCCECSAELLAPSTTAAEDDEDGGDSKPKKRASTAKKPRGGAGTSKSGASTPGAHSEDDSAAATSATVVVVTRCRHVFCRTCFAKKVCAGWPAQVKPADRSRCSACDMDLTPAMDAVEITSAELDKALAQSKDEEDAGGAKRGKKAAKKARPFEHSTKTRALLDDLLPFSRANPASNNYEGRMDEGEAPKPGEWGHTIGFQPVKGEVVKSVVFSQWTKLLDRIGDALDIDKIGYGRLDGGMNRDARNRAMEAFKVDPRCEVLLVSLRAGGVGLNLTAGRRVYLMEPFWNPAVEDQAVDRIYRLGQTQSVQTIRFVMRRSIEKNMLKVQQRKLELIAKSLTNTLSKQDMKTSKLDEIKVYLNDRYGDSDDDEEEPEEDAAAAGGKGDGGGIASAAAGPSGSGDKNGDVAMQEVAR